LYVACQPLEILNLPLVTSLSGKAYKCYCTITIPGPNSVFMITTLSKISPSVLKAVFRNCIFLPLCAISIMLFVFSCDDEDEPEIQYPETGFYGDNILMKGKTDYKIEDVSLRAKLPEGKKIKIVMTVLTSAFPEGAWWYVGGTSNNWAISKFDMSARIQVFQTIDGGHTCDLSMQFDEGTFRIDYYENDATSPTYSKTIVVK